MDLKVEWVSATRSGDEKAAIEKAYRDRLLDLFGSVVAAAEAKGHWHRAYEPPVHHWRTFNTIAFIEATADLTPCERHLAHFVVKFENDN